MTPQRTRKTAQAPPEPDVDPLADLRDPDEPTPETAEPAETPPLDEREAVTTEEWDRARHLAVVAMHADTTAVGFLHRGGACGCWYVAGVTLTAVLPVQANQDEETEDATEALHSL